jgi:hypothetical protein
LSVGRLGPSTAIFARLTTWLSAPAKIIGLGVSDSEEK